jgi:Fructose-2,6-bisphosphatase
MKICLIRHGETDWNALGKLQGREDIPLNEHGIQQAETCAESLKGGEWNAIFTSPLLRASQTACIIAGILNIPKMQEEHGFIERDYGKASGTKTSGFSAEDRIALFSDNSMESLQTLTARLFSALKESVKSRQSENIIIVSHGGAINAILAKLSAGTIGSGKTQLKNACINMLEYNGKAFDIVFYNKTAEELKELL